MSIIAVNGLPAKFKITDVVKALAKAIGGHFEALNFKVPKGKNKNKMKTCYLRLSEKLDPVRIVEKINDFSKQCHKNYRAVVPEKVPDIPLGTKPKRLPLKLRMALRIPDDDNYDEVLKFSTEEIMTELQAKYPGLHSLSKTTGYKLTRELTKKVFTRVEALAQKKNQDFSESCFKMTRGYRRAHPHFGDFQFVLSTLHAIQDANGIPRSQLQESDLTSTPTAPLVLDLPKEKINQLCNTYTAKIVKRMSSHILGLHSAVSQLDTEEELARKQVREELKKLNPFLPDVVSLVVQKHLSPKDGPFYRVRIYGEPFLPNKETMHPFITKYKPVHVMRSSRMYNMIKFNVPPAFFHSLMAMNGTVLNGAKLSICSSDVAKYNRKHGLLGGADDNEDEDEEMEEDQNEEWDEMEEEL